MRYSKEHKAETHARIVKNASVRLREHGAHGVGVADQVARDGGRRAAEAARYDRDQNPCRLAHPRLPCLDQVCHVAEADRIGNYLAGIHDGQG